jgi:hypothetical protein
MIMSENNIQLFEDKPIRTAWDEEKEEWYFSVVDVACYGRQRESKKHLIKKEINRLHAGRRLCVFL